MCPYFLPKGAKNGWIYNTFEKSTASVMSDKRAEGGAFCIFRAFGGPSYRAVVVSTVKQWGRKAGSDKGYRKTTGLPYFCVS